jgi:exodeoxyribonuclease-3
VDIQLLDPSIRKLRYGSPMVSSRKKIKTLRISSWNVNGLRAAAGKGFLDWLMQSKNDIIGLQETRAREDQLDAPLRSPKGYHAHFVAAQRPGYSGVGLLARKRWNSLETSLGIEDFDIEGRLQIAQFGKLWVVNGYFPNGSGKERDNSRVPFKLAFYQKLFEVLEPLRANGGRVLVMGDFNTAHREIDLARPKQNENTSGFLPEERREFDRWCQAGWVDTFRHFEPGAGHYTWWSQRYGVRQKNIGWRIDYILASQGAMQFVENAGIQSAVQGSDHCPIWVEVRPEILGTS